jgi:hypothetical protein
MGGEQVLEEAAEKELNLSEMGEKHTSGDKWMG